MVETVALSKPIRFFDSKINIVDGTPLHPRGLALDLYAATGRPRDGEEANFGAGSMRHLEIVSMKQLIVNQEFGAVS